MPPKGPTHLIRVRVRVKVRVRVRVRVSEGADALGAQRAANVVDRHLPQAECDEGPEGCVMRNLKGV